MRDDGTCTGNVVAVLGARGQPTTSSKINEEISPESNKTYASLSLRGFLEAAEGASRRDLRKRATVRLTSSKLTTNGQPVRSRYRYLNYKDKTTIKMPIKIHQRRKHVYNFFFFLYIFPPLAANNRTLRPITEKLLLKRGHPCGASRDCLYS